MANVDVAIELEEEDPTWRERVDDVLANVQFVTYTLLVVLLLALGFLRPRMFITVPTGSHGVMYRYFAGGTVTERVWARVCTSSRHGII